jgi:sterol desaturase/sphingolipid hydroxylase (fatty acid hydroxylase superfamily)
VSNITKHWRVAYGAICVCASMALILALVLNAPLIATKVIGKFDFAWAIWSRSTLNLGLIPFIGFWALLMLIERRFPAGAVKPATNWFLNLKVNLLTWILIPPLSVLLGVLLGYVSSSAGVGFIDLRLTHATGIGRAVVAYFIWFFAVDFFYYWYHRFQHESFLWQQHKVHHLDEHVSAVTAHRVHWLENIIYLPMVTVPTALLFKFDRSTGGIALGVISIFTGLWQTFFHANLKIGFAWASPLFVSPQLHRIHHSRLPEHHDKNYAGFFPILDVVFGTYYHPRRDEYPSTGVHDEKEVRRFRDSLFLPLREWWRMFRDWRARQDSVLT